MLSKSTIGSRETSSDVVPLLVSYIILAASVPNVRWQT